MRCAGPVRVRVQAPAGPGIGGVSARGRPCAHAFVDFRLEIVPLAMA